MLYYKVQTHINKKIPYSKMVISESESIYSVRTRRKKNTYTQQTQKDRSTISQGSRARLNYSLYVTAPYVSRIAQCHSSKIIVFVQLLAKCIYTLKKRIKIQYIQLSHCEIISHEFQSTVATKQ